MQRWRWLVTAGCGGVLAGALGGGCNMQGGYFGTPAPAGPQPMAAGPGMQPGPAQPGGCQGVCGRYFQCKGGASPADQQSCATQCAQANPDPEGLANLQGMDCPGLVALIDGTTPATSPAGAPQPVAATGGAPKMPAPSGPPHVLPVGPGGAAPSSFGGPNGAGGRAGAPGMSGAQGPAPAAGATAPGTCAAPRTPTADPQLYALLIKNAWCSFSYSGGTTRNSRAVLAQDGVATRGSASETSHSGQFKDGQGNQTGAWGTGSANQGGERGCWRLDGQELMFSADGRQWVPGGLRVTINSSGWPILNVGGTEFMVCN